MTKEKKDKDGKIDYQFTSRAVEDRLQSGREQMADVKETKAPKKKEGKPSGYLDTQLFPNRKSS